MHSVVRRLHTHEHSPFPSPYPLSILFQTVFLAQRVNFPSIPAFLRRFESRAVHVCVPPNFRVELFVPVPRVSALKANERRKIMYNDLLAQNCERDALPAPRTKVKRDWFSLEYRHVRSIMVLQKGTGCGKISRNVEWKFSTASFHRRQCISVVDLYRVGSKLILSVTVTTFHSTSFLAMLLNCKAWFREIVSQFRNQFHNRSSEPNFHERYAISGIFNFN